MVFDTNPRLKKFNETPVRIQHQFTEIGCTDSYIQVSQTIVEYLKSRILQLEACAQKVVGTGFKIEKSVKVLHTKTAKHVYLCLSNNVCTNFKNYFDFFSGGNTRNQGILLRLPKTKLEAAWKSFYFQGAMVFNNLPIEIRKDL